MEAAYFTLLGFLVGLFLGMLVGYKDGRDDVINEQKRSKKESTDP